MNILKKRLSPKLHNRDLGFTLLELMLVIAVMGLLTLFGVPKFQAVKTNYQLEGAAQTVISELNYAKQLAMDQRKTTYVVFNDSTISLVQNVTGAYTVLDSKAIETPVVFDPNLEANDWLAEISSQGAPLGWGFSYNPRGLTSASGTVLLTHNSERRVGINIANHTGKLTMTWP